MKTQKTLACAGAVLLSAVLVAPTSAQATRGKAELKAGTGTITVDYGQPALKGRDMLSQLKEGSFWRMGMNEATVLSTPVDLMFGSTKVAKGSYSLWLKRTGEAKPLDKLQVLGARDVFDNVGVVVMSNKTVPRGLFIVHMIFILDFGCQGLWHRSSK